MGQLIHYMAKNNKLPGYVGWPLVGDKSIEFYRDPIKFYHKYAELYKSRIFVSRILNKPTVFIGTHQGVRQVLIDCADNMNMGYKFFMGDIYGDNILFANGEEAAGLREALSYLFTAEGLHSYQHVIDRIINNEFKQLDENDPVDVYSFFKDIATQICLSLFLGLDTNQSKDLTQQITDLTTAQWHGILSVPLNVHVTKYSSTSYSKALDAKVKLINIIKEQRSQAEIGFPVRLKEVPSLNNDVFINNHLLLFSSALIPKAIASLLMSFFVVTGQPNNFDLQAGMFFDKNIEDRVLMEVQRLYPPFMGGRRLVRKECVIDGYTIPEGYSIVFLTFAAHRDSGVYEEPNTFKPERWLDNEVRTQNKLFTFGAGPRSCIGYHLVMNIIKTIIQRLMTQYTWKSLTEESEINHKWLPVVRPKMPVLIDFNTKVEIRHLGDKYATTL